MTCCFYCKNETTAAHVDRVIYNKMPLYGPWAGWRMAGRDLIAPDRQRISPERLRGLLFREASQKYLTRRRDEKRTACQVVSLPAREQFAGLA